MLDEEPESGRSSTPHYEKVFFGKMEKEGSDDQADGEISKKEGHEEKIFFGKMEKEGSDDQDEGEVEEKEGHAGLMIPLTPPASPASEDAGFLPQEDGDGHNDWVVQGGEGGSMASGPAHVCSSSLLLFG